MNSSLSTRSEVRSGCNRSAIGTKILDCSTKYYLLRTSRLVFLPGKSNTTMFEHINAFGHVNDSGEQCADEHHCFSSSHSAKGISIQNRSTHLVFFKLAAMTKRLGPRSAIISKKQ